MLEASLLKCNLGIDCDTEHDACDVKWSFYISALIN